MYAPFKLIPLIVPDPSRALFQASNSVSAFDASTIALLQLLRPADAHHAGRGWHPGGALGSNPRAAMYESVPHFPSGSKPIAACAAQTRSTFARSHGSMAATSRTASTV